MKKTNIKGKVIKGLTSALLCATVMCINILPVFAVEGGAPEGVQTDTLNKLVNVVFWVVRIAILAAGGIPASIKIVQGQTDENPRDRNAGITAWVVTGVVFAATFAIQALMV